MKQTYITHHPVCIKDWMGDRWGIRGIATFGSWRRETSSQTGRILPASHPIGDCRCRGTRVRPLHRSGGDSPRSRGTWGSTCTMTIGGGGRGMGTGGTLRCRANGTTSTAWCSCIDRTLLCNAWAPGGAPWLCNPRWRGHWRTPWWRVSAGVAFVVLCVCSCASGINYKWSIQSVWNFNFFTHHNPMINRQILTLNLNIFPLFWNIFDLFQQLQ